MVKTFFELGSKKDKFKSSKPKETGNGGGDYEKDENGNGGNGNGCNGKPPNWKRKSTNRPKGPVKCFLCDDLHMMRDCQMKYMFSTTEGDDEPTRASTKSMILNPIQAKRDRKQKGLMYMDINIAGQKKSAVIDTRVLNFFISDKAL
ncbi:hypothetical protein Goklo_014061, partial [Gossypium klotzschianum]|nr:hypothetical protein [Gossypium klotzschianum]